MITPFVLYNRIKRKRIDLNYLNSKLNSYKHIMLSESVFIFKQILYVYFNYEITIKLTLLLWKLIITFCLEFVSIDSPQINSALSLQNNIVLQEFESLKSNRTTHYFITLVRENLTKILKYSFVLWNKIWFWSSNVRHKYGH